MSETTKEPSDDGRVQAEALRVAERWLLKQGWGFTPADVGKRAREILEALKPAEGSQP